MDKLKFLRKNGLPILVNESTEIKDCIALTDRDEIIIVDDANYENWHQLNCSKIIFADPSLSLNLPPIPNWKAWEVNKLAWEKSIYYQDNFSKNAFQDANTYKAGFIEGRNSNKAEFTEDDLRKAIEKARLSVGNLVKTPNEIIQSLKKDPSFIIMEGNEIKEVIY